ncbi:trypsin-like peptidase domain-containing protein [Actinoplanes sp. NPDC026623]|uniref:trypsin-like peptidase domain-containing protein n=1 Tax=Actinoplanes sp. NPDC026623 TaxID=3155610 RepID=UPI0033DACD7E
MDESFGSAGSDERYVVQIRGRRFLGSGFFVRRNVVATCAHVVEGLTGELSIRWMGRSYAARVLVRDPPERGDAIDYPGPDVAFLGVEEVDHPVPVIDGQPVKAGGPPALVPCYTAFNPDGEVRALLQEVRITGREESFILLRGEDLLPGMSGAPIVVDGHIRGMVKSGTPLSGQGPGPGRALNGRELARTLRRHWRAIGHHDTQRPTLRPPHPGEPLHQLLSAHGEAAKRFPYRIVQLTGRRPPSLSEVYVEQRTSQRRTRGADTVYETHLLRPTAMLRRHRHVLLVGGAGGGKSTLLQQLAGNTAGWWCGTAGQGSDEPEAGRVAAVLVSAADLAADLPWFAMLAGSVQRRLGGLLSEPVGSDLFLRPPAPGADWLVCVDGLDEIPDRELRGQVLANLTYHLHRYGSRVRYLIASRSLHDEEFAQLRSGFDGVEGKYRLGEYSLQEFDDDDVAAFAAGWFKPAPETTADEFLAAVRTGQLTQLVRIPLMATITAIVYEQRPSRPLPIDRFGLYEQFVHVMLHLRVSQNDAREGLLRQFRQFGPAAEQYGERLVAERETILRHLAVRHIVEQIPVAEALREWIGTHAAERPPGIGPEHIGELVVQTGLVFRTGNQLDFLHRSFAEFLTARQTADGFDPAAWLTDVRLDGPDSLGLFRFAAWIRAGHDPRPIIQAKLGVRNQRRHENLRDVAILIEDGGILTFTDGGVIVDLTWRAVREHGGDERSVDLVRRALKAVFGRTRDTRPLTVLLADRRAPVHKRVEAALLLLDHGAEHERRLARERLVAFAYRTRVSEHDRLWALFQLAEHGGDRERRHAVQSMVALAETTPRADVRTRAVGLLAQTGERIAALSALVRRALEPDLHIDDRIAALDLLFMFELIVDERDVAPDEEAAGWELDDGMWRPARRGRLSDPELSVLDGALRAALIRMGRHDAASAALLIARFVRDRERPWMRRLRLLQQFDGPLAAAAEAGIRMMVDDPGADAANRVTLVRMSGVFREEREAILLAWIRDPDASPGLRQAALDTLVDIRPALKAEFAGDPGLDVTLRIAALRRPLPDVAAFRELRGRVRALAADHRRPRDRLVVGLTLAGLKAGELVVRARAAYRRRKEAIDSISAHQAAVGETQGDDTERSQKS